MFIKLFIPLPKNGLNTLSPGLVKKN